MIQQVNLYQDILKQGQAKPLVNIYVYGLVAMITFMIGYSFYVFTAVNNTKNNIQIARQQLTEAESRIQILRIQHPKQQINKLLTQEISSSQNILNSLSQVIHLLTDKTSDQTRGFSRYFSALARQSTANLWLTNIAINAQQHTIDLHGSTYQAEKTALLLQKLHHETIFQGRSFAKLSMSQSEENDRQINFVISTINEPLEQESHD